MGYRGRDSQKNAENFVPGVVRVLWDKLRKAFWKDWQTKLFALLFALALWFFLFSERI